MTKIVAPPDWEVLLAELLERDRSRMSSILPVPPDAIAPGGKYRHWDRLRHLTPPGDLTVEEWWVGVKLARLSARRSLPLTDDAGRPFSYCLPDRAHELLHAIDQHASGEIRAPERVFATDDARRQYLVNSMIEEAIRSSQLEGASTSRRVAKEMIRSGRAPRDRSERMILNNYNAMRFMDDEMRGRDLTRDAVLALHRILTEGTLDDPDAAGRLQRPDEERVKVWDADGSVLHVPPPAASLEGRLASFCAFANEESEPGKFVHPVIRSIVLHFWLAYDHPFEDGNGRTARTLFYWSMLRRGYWLTEYLSISRIIREGPGRYYRAFLETETDEGDLTYFILFHLEVIQRAIDELYERVQAQVREMRELEGTIRPGAFNFRQTALLKNALLHPDAIYTFRSHARSHGVSFQTARTDLLALRRKRLLTLRRVGRQYTFSPAQDLREKLTGG